MSNQKKIIYVYKGFTEKYISENVEIKPLVDNSYENRTNVLFLTDDYKRKLMAALMSTQLSTYVIYEEFILLQELGEDVLNLSGFAIEIIRNTMFPEYYLLQSDDKELINQLSNFEKYRSSFDEVQQPDENIIQLQRFYGDVKYIQGLCFISYKNDERLLQKVTVRDTISKSKV